jgi:hypothetical protein
MTLASKPVKILFAAVVVVGLGPLFGSITVTIFILIGCMLHLKGCFLSTMSFFPLLVRVAYYAGVVPALILGILFALWMLWRPLTVGVSIFVALILSICELVTYWASFSPLSRVAVVLGFVGAAIGCWGLIHRFERIA